MSKNIDEVAKWFSPIKRQQVQTLARKFTRLSWRGNCEWWSPVFDLALSAGTEEQERRKATEAQTGQQMRAPTSSIATCGGTASKSDDAFCHWLHGRKQKGQRAAWHALGWSFRMRGASLLGHFRHGGRFAKRVHPWSRCNPWAAKTLRSDPKSGKGWGFDTWSASRDI